jgi:hypothetical protein
MRQAARLLAGLVGDRFIDPEGELPPDPGLAVTVDGGDLLAASAWLLVTSVRELAKRSGRTPLEVASDLAGLVDHPDPGAPS